MIVLETSPRYGVGMDVWHRSGHRDLARYARGGRDFILVGRFGCGTPVGQFDQYDLVDAVTRKSVLPADCLYDCPCAEDIDLWLAAAADSAGEAALRYAQARRVGAESICGENVPLPGR